MEDENLKEELKLHVAGATVKHNSPFESLKSYEHEFEVDQDFIEKWVRHFYMNISRTDDQWINFMGKVYQYISDKVILINLGDFNWRTRKTGAFFAAIKDKKDYIDIIGTHLVKSEVCCAGGTYAIVLAYFNNKRGNEYLEKYLDYYLKLKDLDFDQVSVFLAVKYLDEINGTNKIDKYVSCWHEFLKGKYDGEEERKEYLESLKQMQTHCIRKQIETIEKIKISAANNLVKNKE